MAAESVKVRDPFAPKLIAPNLKANTINSMIPSEVPNQ